jgi:hypothetical protein
MRLYPDIPSRRANTAALDAGVLIALLACAAIGLWVFHVVDSLEILGRGVHDAGTAVQSGFGTAADKVHGIPLVGGSLAGGLRDAGNATGGPVADAGTRGEHRVHRLALTLGLLIFLLPALTLLGRYVPGRLAQIRKLNDAEQVLDPRGDPERRRLVAMRAAFALPYAQLLAYTHDPIGDLAEGRYDGLIAAIAEDAGLRR